MAGHTEPEAQSDSTARRVECPLDRSSAAAQKSAPAVREFNFDMGPEVAQGENVFSYAL
jgi:hypothetical protein